MKYPASTHYPDLDPSDPIPRIEPRCDVRRVFYCKRLVRWTPWILASAAAVWGLLVILLAPLWSRTVVALCFFLVIGLLEWRTHVRCRAEREQWAGRSKSRMLWGIPYRLAFRTGLCVVSIWLLVLLWLVGSDVTIVFILLSGAAIGGGSSIAVTSFFLREPGQISCERCSYPLVGLTLPCSCPECGHALRDLSSTTDRPRVPGRHLLLLGIVLAGLGAVAMGAQIRSPGFVYRVLPTPALISIAHSDIGAFEALVNGEMSPEQEQALEEAMIAALVSGDTRGGWSYAQGDWLTGRVLGGRVSEDQIGAIVGTLGEAFIDGPGRVVVGERVSLMLRAPEVRMPVWDLSPSYYFSGYDLSIDEPRHLGSGSPRRWRSMVEGEVSSEPDGTGSPWFRFTPASAGTITVRARMVLVIYPGQREIDGAGFVWNEGGSFGFENPPLWSGVVDLEHTIEVVGE